MSNAIINIKKLQNNGFVEFFGGEGDFEKAALSLGNPIASRSHGGIVDILQAKEKNIAHPNSKSAANGLGEFTFHSDGAFFATPPRYIALRYQGTEATEIPTQLKFVFDELHSSEFDYLRNDIWQVRGKTVNFYSSIITNNKIKKQIIRFDNDCMKPNQKDSCANLILNGTPKDGLIYSVNWLPGKILIFDNWRILHARPSIPTSEKNKRILKRIMIHV